jgi:UDP-3-O-[3-hydroxymyristoyl] N-acetylglucosamine deacetylase
LHYPKNSYDTGLQRTLKNSIHCTGVGVHSGLKTSLRLVPAAVDAGITFVRTDITGRNNVIKACWDGVTDTQLCTVVSNEDGASVGTVEHLMAALRGCSIDNVTIELDGPEVPIMDGSAEPFVFLIECAGIETQSAPRTVIRILKPIEVREEGKYARLDPADEAGYSFDIDFAPRLDLQQHYDLRINGTGFKRFVSRARTFGFLEDVDKLRSMGLARGGSLDNAIVISGDKVLNKDGLRYEDELVRHKVLDAVGDLYLAGMQIMGHYTGYRVGHAMNNKLLHALFADPSAWVLTSAVDGELSPAAMAELSEWQSGALARTA